jgi:hypothetical protein
VLIAVVASTAVSVIASFLGNPMLAPPVFVDLVACVACLPMVDEALPDQYHPLASRRSFLVN